MLRWGSLLILAAVGGAPANDKSRPTTFVDIRGAKHTPLDTKDAKATVLFFAVTDCPVVNYFTSEINSIVKDHTSKGVRFFVVHVDPDLTPEAARKHAKEYGLTCPILIDAKHELVKATRATITPEAAVFTPDGKLVYIGRIDDRYVELGKRRIEPTRRDVREALAAILAGKPVKEARTQAIGCPIPELTERK
ncbi:MAG: redoxin domain-containing protein [Planctomycetes bacterium]|nr:redoxin domain-containing protein [Planctomycetota bacterium]